MVKYWEDEDPVEVNTGRNIIRWYRGAERLQICGQNWLDGDGNEQRGKTVTLNIAAVRTTPEALDIFKQIIAV